MNYITVLDNEILWALRNNFRREILDNIAVLIFKLSQFGFIWIVITLILLLKKQNRRSGITVAIGMILSFIFCYFSKYSFFNRMPPFLYDSDIILLVKAPMGSCFPSVSTVLGFSAAVAFSIRKKQLSSLAIFLATLTAITQLYLMVCYPTDILISIIMGIICGYVGVFLTNHLIPYKII